MMETKRRTLESIDSDLVLDPLSKRNGLSTSIMATSRQIHDEASAILYGRNCFYWDISSRPSRAPLQDGDPGILLLPARYIGHITRIHFGVSFYGAGSWLPVADDVRAISSTHDELRRRCLVLVPNRVREVRVTYHDTSLMTAETLLMTIPHFSPRGAIRNRIVRIETILEPLKLLNGVAKFNFDFDGLPLPGVAKELKQALNALAQAMTAPKVKTLAAKEAGPSSDVGVDGDVAQQAGSSINDAGK